MYTQEQQKQGQELLNTLSKKAQENSEFKNELVSNPKKTISKVLGVDISAYIQGKDLVVEDQSNSSVIYLNIPARVSFDELELTEEQLSQLSGGVLPLLAAYAIGCGVGIGVCWLVSKL